MYVRKKTNGGQNVWLVFHLFAMSSCKPKQQNDDVKTEELDDETTAETNILILKHYILKLLNAGEHTTHKQTVLNTLRCNSGPEKD